ncbi:hypothetical protein TUM20903_36320 [Citrobacter koseri]|nr:hypothetical protein TUM13189_36540 [Citrobacter koseri]BDG90894.1 hypothetical protein TUM20903_36320 [Citrobacter koseri]
MRAIRPKYNTSNCFKLILFENKGQKHQTKKCDQHNGLPQNEYPL